MSHFTILRLPAQPSAGNINPAGGTVNGYLWGSTNTDPSDPGDDAPTLAVAVYRGAVPGDARWVGIAAESDVRGVEFRENTGPWLPVTEGCPIPVTPGAPYALRRHWRYATDADLVLGWTSDQAVMVLRAVQPQIRSHVACRVGVELAATIYRTISLSPHRTPGDVKWSLHWGNNNFDGAAVTAVLFGCTPGRDALRSGDDEFGAIRTASIALGTLTTGAAGTLTGVTREHTRYELGIVSDGVGAAGVVDIAFYIG